MQSPQSVSAASTAATRHMATRPLYTARHDIRRTVLRPTVFRPVPSDGRSRGPKPYTTSTRHFFVQRLAFRIRERGEGDKVLALCFVAGTSSRQNMGTTSFGERLAKPASCAEAPSLSSAGAAAVVRYGKGHTRNEADRRASRRAKTKSPPRGLPQGGRESSSDLLSRTRRPGTIGDRRLNFRVRNGNGCDPPSITAETMS